ncbi:MAG TPA: Mut7-C RNAse domain-containing protein [Acidobacteriota bacterium]|nr:Mut7-C RNAse domain-containing protein [Acidobacteriota bacterium]
MSISPKFACDDHCGRLARWLRVLGFDCTHDQNIQDADLLRLALDEDRIILTRDARLAAHTLARQVILLQPADPLAQVVEVMRSAGLTVAPVNLFARCSRCNVMTEPTTLAAVAERLPPYVRRTQTVFRVCPSCDRIYWRATHVDHMLHRLRSAGIIADE